MKKKKSVNKLLTPKHLNPSPLGATTNKNVDCPTHVGVRAIHLATLVTVNAKIIICKTF